MNCAHLSGACSGRFRVLPPLVLVGLHGIEKYLISSAPSLSFLFFSFNTSPQLCKEAGRPNIRARICVQCHCEGSRVKPRCLPIQTRSKEALKAVLIILLSVKASNIFVGISSPLARSTSCTLPPSHE